MYLIGTCSCETTIHVHVIFLFRDDNITVDEDVEEAARDLMELNDDGHKTRKRKQSMLQRLSCVCV